MTEKLQPATRPVVLCILDGWGYLPNGASNSITLAHTPNWNQLTRTAPHGIIEASEHNVGLPDGQMGNSEVGHMNLGAGRVVMQELPRIDAAIKDGTLAKNEALGKFIATLKETGGTAHLLGLMSPGGVHAHQRHIAALAHILTDAGVKVAVHAFLDGRDTPPKSAGEYLATFAKDVAGAKGASVATVIGRFYAMDRDNRWDRVEAAYRALVSAEGAKETEPVAAVEASHKADVTDEFVKPVVIGDYAGMKDGDGVLMANFRSDRAREILAALLDPKFDKFDRGPSVKFAAALGMVDYSTELKKLMATIFEPDGLENTFGEIVARAGWKQLRIAETEKYAHVTFFFNGGREEVFEGEERILVPSPKVATYDLKPEMSAYEVTDKLVDAIGTGRFDVVVVNYANADMVGHSGNIEAAKQAVEAVDTCLGRLADAVAKAGGTLLITADHGNVEQMTDPETGQPHTAHTTNPVPLVLINPPGWVKAVAPNGGKLADIAPTLLALLGLPRPKSMTGSSLLVPSAAPAAARASA
ncbi:2,3-bisphosphoglycerate-independent phosphoglycerate mutase [Aliidongia dinghuensis]|uniref:2,3-bisphosphoglycerate-independent phosphoglycerate mutase n=1 Tax=Aliidongia dinghuensis TaxID=1867774 RepID=A0A8J3E279_9PROT|nr:2,3-bisphosphoglycerate-independent phosphoglycerate mutase [Aliidongia dinghuensis]GGF18645.1 2,3-bisphosphoglycerate-independent phosphoglycerate mutase [Aliidongia dinghuensis]